MIFRRKLACSFCRRSDAEVEKLVAGPRAYICDRCAAEAVRIMNSSDLTPTAPMVPPRWTWPALVRRLHRVWRGLHQHFKRNSIADPQTLVI